MTKTTVIRALLPILILGAVPVPATAAPAGPGTVLYTANWSTGLNGWSGSGDWKTLRGVLLNDGTGDGALLMAPFRTGNVADYAVEARIRVVRTGDFFSLVTRRATAGGGYHAAVQGGSRPTVFYVGQAYWNTLADCQQFDPGDGWHTYRLEADGNVITYLVDGARITSFTDNRYIDGGMTALASDGYQLEVSSYRIIQLR